MKNLYIILLFLILILPACTMIAAKNADSSSQDAVHPASLAQGEDHRSAAKDESVPDTVKNNSASDTFNSEETSFLVEDAEHDFEIAVQGELTANQIIDLGPETGGEVIQILVDKGDRVRKGMALAKLRNANLETQLLQLEQQMDELRFMLSGDQATPSQLQTQLEQNERNMNFAIINLQRMEKLEGRSVSEKELDSLENQVQSAFYQVELTKNQIRNNQMKLQHLIEQRQNLEKQIQRLIITSPIDGVVLKRNIDIGEYCAASPQGILFTLAQDHPLRLTIHLSEQLIPMVTDDSIEKKLLLPSVQEDPITDCTVIPQVDEQNRRISIETKIKNTAHTLVSGMFVQGMFTIKHRAIYIPLTAIHYKNDGTPYVLTLQNQQWEPTPIQTGISANNYIQVVNGLEKNSHIKQQDSWIIPTT